MVTSNELKNKLAKAENWRRSIEDNWKLLYELYTNNYRPNIPQYGAVVNTGKVFELTETFVSYFMQALIFQEKFFDASPVSPNSQQYQPMALELLAELINTSNFQKIMGEVLRQVVLTGNTGASVRVVGDRLMFECLDIFRTYLLPGHSVEFPNFIYKYILSEGQLYDFWRGNKYIKGKFEDFKKNITPQTREDIDYSNNTRGTQSEVASELYEICAHYYWCYSDNKYKCCWFSKEVLYEEVIEAHEIPIVCAVNTLPGSPYGYSPLESCVGLISELTALKSYRLTAAKIASWYMFTSNDNMLPDDLEFLPNKVFHTSERESLQPLPMPANGYEVNAAEEQNLVSTIYTNVGLGSGVSANVARQAERVTATEIDALQRASGARLNLLFNVLETQLFSPLINYAATCISKAKGKRKIRVYNVVSDSFDVFEASFKLLEDFRVILDVSQVKYRLETVQKLLDFLGAIVNVPEANAVIDYKNIILDITHLYGLPDPQRYIKQQEPIPEAPTQPQQLDPMAINPDDNRILEQMIKGGMGGDPSMAAMVVGDNPNDPQAFIDAKENSLLQEQISQQQAIEQDGMYVSG